MNMSCPQQDRDAGIVKTVPLATDADKPAISVIGLGYVGAVSMACMAKLGFRMVGVDLALDKVRSIKEGRSPMVEPGLEDLLMDGVAKGNIDATQNLIAAVLDTDITFMSVGTPTNKDGSCDLTYVRQASRAIGQALAMKQGYHVVVLRCSVPPGTTSDLVAREIAAASGRQVGKDFGVCFNPEFLREGVAVADFYSPPKTVIGASDLRAETIISGIYSQIDDRVLVTSIEAAEMVKYVDNVWHATKVAFANEIGRLCKSLEIDSHDVMDIFVQDTKLNLSPYYLKPGFAFGGSCLPKEVRAVGHLAAEHGVDMPLVDSLMKTNQRQIDEALRMLAPHSGKRIGFLGVAFKPNTDDLRESPVLTLMASLKDAGENLIAYDRNLGSSSNLQCQINYIRHASPGHAAIMEGLTDMLVADADALVAGSDVVVVAHATKEFRAAIMARGEKVHVIDLVRLFRDPPQEETYEGIAW